MKFISSTPELYRYWTREQRSWMQRGHLFALIADPKVFIGFALSDADKEEFVMLQDEVIKWVRECHPTVSLQQAGWTLHVAIPNPADAVAFKLTFC